MNELPVYLSALIVGVLGGVHCIGMCGGIAGVLSMGLDKDAGKVRLFAMQLFYNLGRISSYIIAGIFFGLLGEAVLRGSGSHVVHQYLQTFSGVFMILLGLYLSGWWRVLTRVEQVGGLLWKRIEPFARSLIPIRKLHNAYAVGMVWGWLPCGLVYSMLGLSLASGSGMEGGLIMLSFGLGTLPNLIAFGLLAASLRNFVRRPVVRYAAGLLVIGFGVWLIWQVWLPADPHVHHHH